MLGRWRGDVVALHGAVVIESVRAPAILSARRGAFVLLALAVVVGLPRQARADLDSGVCTLTSVTVSYGNTGPLAGSASFSFSGGPAGTTCTPAPNTSNLPSSLITTVSLFSSGVTDQLVKTCELTEAIGTYGMSFGSTWAASSGTYEFVGDAGGAVIRLLDLTGAILVGVVELQLSPLSSTNIGEIEDCAGNDMDSLTYIGTITFTDP